MAGLSIRMTLDAADTVDQLSRWREHAIPAARAAAVRAALRAGLPSAIDETPVHTGRARSAWVRGLAMLGGEPPTHWTGPAPDASAITQGAERGHVVERDSASSTTIEVRNEVPYAVFLEFGTSRRPPRSMLKPALLAARPVLRVAFLSRWEEARS